MKDCRWKTWLCTAALAGAIASVWTAPAWADIPIATFEMDGNKVSNGGTDWDSPPPVPPFLLHIDITDSPNPGGHQMTQGTKDVDDISDWVAKEVTNTTPKDDLQVVEATAINTSEGTIAYFSAVRLSVQGGTTSFGFWVFGSKVTYNPPDDLFDDDAHVEGDGLIVVDVGGNAIEGVRVFRWESGELVQIQDAGAAECSDFDLGGANYETNICGEVSADGLHLEVAVDLDDTLGNLCVSSAMATTRTSNTPRASVKNFVLLPEFDLCSIDVTKTCEVVEVLDPFAPLFLVEYTAFVENSGSASFSDSAQVTLYDDEGLGLDMPPGSDNDQVVGPLNVADLSGYCFNDPTTLCMNDGQCTDGTCSRDDDDSFGPGEVLVALTNGVTGSFQSDINGPDNSIAATLTDTGGLSVPAKAVTVTCDTKSVSPMLYAEKMCETVLEEVGETLAVRINFSGKYCNTGDIALDVDVDDPTAGFSGSDTLQDGVPCGIEGTGDCSTLPLSGTCVGVTPGTCAGGGNPGASCTEDATCTGGGTCVEAEAGVCVDTEVELYDPGSGTCNGGTSNAGACSTDTDCTGGGVCENARLVCNVFGGDYLPSGTVGSDGFCHGGLFDGDPCSVNSDCTGGVCLIDPAEADFANQVTITADEENNPLLDTTAGDDSAIEVAPATCDLCPQPEE